MRRSGLEEPQHRNLHPNLHPLLLEFHGIDGQLLRAVRHNYVEGCLAEIALEFDQDCLIVKAEPSDDTVTFHLIRKEDFKLDGSIDVGHSETWRNFIGNSFGWGWIVSTPQK